MGKAPVIGLDIGTFAVRAVELVPRSGKPSLTRLGQVTLPAGAVVDGEVVDVAAVAGALSRLWEEVHFKSRDVVVGVSGPRVIVRQARTALMSADDMRAGLRYQAQELLPIPIEDTHLDFCILDRDGEPQGDGGDGGAGGDDSEPMMTVLLAAAQHEVVSSHLAAAEAAGLHPVSVDVLPLALLRAFPSDGRPGFTEAVVSVGAGLTTVVAREDGVPRFVRALAVGGEDITAAIEADLGCDMAYAEDLKRRAAAEGRASVATLSRASALLAEHVRPLVEEIRGSFDYYLAQSHVDQIDRISLTGGAVNTWGLLNGLQGSLAPEIVIGDPFVSVELGDTGLDAAQIERARPFMAGAIGLALGAIPDADAGLRINLLPDEVVVARRKRRQTVAVGAGVGSLALALGGLWGLQLHQVAVARVSAANAEIDVQDLQSKLDSLANVAKVQTDISSRQQAIGSVLADDIDYQRLLQQVTAVLPNDVWLTSFSVQTGAQTGARGVPTKVTIAASGLSEDAVVRWVRQVSTLPSLTNVWVPNTSKNAANGQDIVTFMSTADVTPAAFSDRAVTLSGRAR